MLIKMMDYCRYVNDGRYYYQLENGLEGWRWDETLAGTVKRQFDEELFPGDWAEEFVIRFQVGRKSHIKYAIEYMNEELFDLNIYLVVHNTVTNRSEVCLVDSWLKRPEVTTLRQLNEALFGKAGLLKIMARNTCWMGKSILDTVPTLPLPHDYQDRTRRPLPYNSQNRNEIYRQMYGSILISMVQNEEPFEDACCGFVYWLTSTFPDYAKQAAGYSGDDDEELYSTLHEKLSEEWYEDMGGMMMDKYHEITNSPEMLFVL